MSVLVFVVTQRPPRTTRTGTLFPYTTLFRSLGREPGRGTLSGKLARGLGKPLDAATPGWGVHAPARQLAEIEQALCDRAMGCSACHGIVDAQHQCPPLRTALRRRIARRPTAQRSEEHTSELQSLMRISYAVFCLNKKISHT